MSSSGGVPAPLDVLWRDATDLVTLFDEVPLTPTANTYTHTIQHLASSTNGTTNAAGILRITGDVAPNANDRRLWLAKMPSFADSEIRSLWYAYDGVGHFEFGHIHRAQHLGSATDQVALACFNDVAYGIVSIVNLNVFTGTGATFTNVGVNQNFDGLSGLPYWVASRLVGTAFSVKAWPRGTLEPGWEDPDAVYAWDASSAGVTLPAGPGRHGIFQGHPVTGQWGEYGEVHITPLTQAETP